MTRTPRQPLPKIHGKNKAQIATRIISTLGAISVTDMQQLYLEVFGAPTISTDRRQMTSDIARRVSDWVRGEAEIGNAAVAP